MISKRMVLKAIALSGWAFLPWVIREVRRLR